MLLRTGIARVTVGDRIIFTTGDSFLQNIDVVLGEQERSSSCNLSIFDPGLKILNLFLEQFQIIGGIAIPKNLLEKTDATATTDTTTTSTVAATTVLTVGANPTGDDLAKAIIKECFADQVTYAEQIAYILGTVQRESSMGTSLIEVGNSDKYKGRGYVQLTGSDNYAKFSKLFNLDLINKPELAADPKNALPILVKGMRDGLFTGKKLSDYIKPGNIDFFNARRIVNSLDHAQDIANYAAIWLKKLPSLGYVAPGTTPDSTTKTDNAADLLSGLKDPTKKTSDIDISQGILVLIELGVNDIPFFQSNFEFLLTGIRGENTQPNVTKISGKQVRAVIAQGGNVYKTYTNVSIEQLAKTIAAKVGATVSITPNAASGIIYPKLVQKENDYQFLLKLAKSSGLFLRGDAKTLKLDNFIADADLITIPAEALMTGSYWGDEADTNRILKVTLTPTTQKLDPNSAAGILSTLKDVDSGKSGILSLDQAPVIVYTTTTTGNSTTTGAGNTTGTANSNVTSGENIIFTAFKNLIASHEVPNYQLPQSYYANNGVSGNTGYFTDSDIVAGGGFPASAGRNYNVGRYQFNRGDWEEAKANNPAIKGYYPSDQELVCDYKLQIRGCTPLLLKGDIAGAIANGGKEWASLPGSPYGQVQAGYSVADAVNIYNSELQKLQGGKATTSTTGSVTTSGSATTTTTNNGVGKGFEGQIVVNTLVLPKILQCKPGSLVKFGADTSLGDAIAREYRIGEVHHTYGDGGLRTVLSIYLPVAIKPTSGTSSSTEVSTTGTQAGASTLPATQQATPKSGDMIAGFTVTSPFGLRSSPGGIGSTNHKGCDLGVPVGTPLKVVAPPGTKVAVTCLTPDQSGGGGNVAVYTAFGLKIMEMHCSVCNAGTYNAGDVCAFSGSTGNSTGAHLHFETRQPDGTSIPPARGYIEATITGKLPSS